MKQLIISTLALFIAFTQLCFSQDIRGFIMQKYEDWLSCQDSVISIECENQIFPIKDILRSQNKENFWASIKYFDVSLSFPKVAVAQVCFEKETIFFEINYELILDCKEECCHSENSPQQSYMHFIDSIEPSKWMYNLVGIFDSDGYSLAIDGFVEKDYLHCPFSIQDKDGFVNVREGRLRESKIVGQIKADEIAFYTPSVVSDWWRVYKFSNTGPKFWGYVHKSRIYPYQTSSPTMRAKIEDLMH